MGQARCGKPSSIQIGGNYIGTNANGFEDLGNDENGILFTGGRGEVGDEKVSDYMGEGGIFMRKNLISGNGQNGIKISDSANNIVVSGNYIGTTASGNGPLGNSQNGVGLQPLTLKLGLERMLFSLVARMET